MYINSTTYREFYPQNNLNFKFTVYDYSSDNFQVGVSGHNSVHFLFSGGLIYDHEGDMIGSFNGQPVSINSYLTTGSYSYYVQEKPTARDIQLTTGHQYWSVCSKIFDGNSINLDSYVYGTTSPDLSFSDLFTLNGISGKIRHSGSYPIRLLYVDSPSVTGGWTFPTVMQPGVYYNFYNNSVSGLNVGAKVSLNIDSTLGKRNYTLKVQEEGSGGDAEEETSDIEPIEGSKYLEVWKASGDFLPIQSDYIYQIDYVVSGAQLDLNLDYYIGKTGDLTLSQYHSATIRHSGYLNVGDDNLCKGFLKNNKPVNLQSVTLDALNTQNIGFKPNFDNKYFEDLFPTGTVSLDVSLTGMSFSLNDTNISPPNYFVDLGGHSGVFGSPTSRTRSYSVLSSYKDIPVYDGKTYETFYADVGVSDDAEHLFSTVSSDLSGVLLFNDEILMSDPLVEDEGERLIYPYRGVGFASNVKEDVLLVSGDPLDGLIPFCLIKEKQPTMFFRNIPNITYNGELTLEKGSTVSGIILFDGISYKKEGGDFSLTTVKQNKEQLSTSYIQDALSVYNFLNPVSGISNLNSELYVDNVKVGKKTNWNNSNFLSISKASLTNDITTLDYVHPFKCAFYPTGWFMFNEKEFLYNSGSNFIDHRSYEETSSLLPFNITYSYGHDKNSFFTSGITRTPLVAKSSKATLRCISNDTNSKAYIKVPFIPINVKYSKYNNVQIKIHEDDTGFVQLYCPQSSDTIKHLNFDLSSLSISGGFKTIATAYQFNDLPDIAHIYVSLVDNASSAALSNCTSLKTGHFRDLYLKGSNFSSTVIQVEEIFKYQSLLDSSALFDYFLYKIHNTKGNFINHERNRFNLKNVYISDNVPMYNNISLAFSHERNQNRNIDKYIKSPSDYTLTPISSAGSLGAKLKEFFLAKIWVGDGTNLFCGARLQSNSFFGFSITDSSITIFKANETFETISSSDVTYGAAVTEIIRVINFFGLEPTSKVVSYTQDAYSYLARVPSQFVGDVTPMTIAETSTVMFSGQIQRDKTLYIPAGYARYYPNNLNSKTYGYFHESDGFFTCKNESVSKNGVVTSFPYLKENLNSKAEFLLNVTDLSGKSQKLSRLLMVKKDLIISASRDANEVVELQTAFFDFTTSSAPLHTGTFTGYVHSTTDIWRAWIADDIEMTQNLTELFLSPDSSSLYQFNDIGINDNYNHTKFLKIRQTEPFWKFSGVRDELSAKLIIKSGSTTFYSLNRSVP